MEHLTIREAARQLGITPQALRSRAKHRGVSLEKAPGPHGDRYLVKAADLCFLADETVSQNRSATARDRSARDGPTATRDGSASERYHSTGRSPRGHQAAARNSTHSSRSTGAKASVPGGDAATRAPDDGYAVGIDWLPPGAF